MEGLDEKDHAILDVLKGNSSLSIQKIAKKTGIPIATVHNRIKRLKAAGIITGYSIRLDKAKLGKKLTAYILINVVQKTNDLELLDKLMKNGLVESGSVVAGTFDIVLRVCVADIEELNTFTLKYLKSFGEIGNTQTVIAFKTIEK
jgi:Lrp/AsnC family leucine-responsive transcriptional regulator